jgi:hypothetical protein
MPCCFLLLCLLLGYVGLLFQAFHYTYLRYCMLTTHLQVPSTINRAYSLAHPDNVSFGLNFVGAFVLPLQGFWNSLIYISISWPAFKLLWQDILTKAGMCHVSCFKAKIKTTHSLKESGSSETSVTLEEDRMHS